MLSTSVRRMATVSPSQIKTLSQAYKEGKLSAKHSSLFKPSDEINSKVSLWCGFGPFKRTESLHLLT